MKRLLNITAIGLIAIMVPGCAGNNTVKQEERNPDAPPLNYDYLNKKHDPPKFLVEDDLDDIYPIYNHGKYHYAVNIVNASSEWETFEPQRMINGEVRMRKTSPDLSYLNGTYIWDSDIYLPDEDAMFRYIYTHYNEMKRYKIGP